MFCIDTPIEDRNEINEYEIFSGWFIDDQQYSNLILYVNNEPYSQIDTNLFREDVAKAHPDKKFSLISGWKTDFVVEDKYQDQLVSIKVINSHNNSCLYEGSFMCKKSYDQNSNSSFYSIFKENSHVHHFLNKPTFLSTGSLPIVRISEKTSTHAYSEQAKFLIDKNKGGLVLDLGCGNTPKSLLFDHVVKQDVVLYENVDVLVNDDSLPYKDNTFDLIVSQAVFEHIQYPWVLVKELHRVLKKDGLIYIETAFMQPRHGDPYHFFNMTLDGIKTLFEDFEEIETGVKPHQQLTDGFLMQIDALQPYINDKEVGIFFSEFVAYIKENKQKVDNSVSGMGEYIIPAGVFFLGKK